MKHEVERELGSCFLKHGSQTWHENMFSWKGLSYDEKKMGT